MKLWQRRLLGVLSLGGGAVGATLTVQQMLAWKGGMFLLVYLCAIVVYCWGAWTGLLLIEGRDGAERLNRRFWMLQVPLLKSPLIGGFLWSGLNVSISLGVWPIGLNWNVGIGGSFQFNLLQRTEPFAIGVNLFALGVVVWLGRKLESQVPQPAAEVS